MRGNENGWVRMVETDAQLVAARVDLAAALLRARAKDLAALREVRRTTEVSSEDVDRVLEIVALEDAEVVIRPVGFAGKELRPRLDREGSFSVAVPPGVYRLMID